MISAEQERNLADANARAKKKQDRTHPHVVNVDDGRLMPNTPRLRVHEKYRVYAGPVGPDVTNEKRLQWLAGHMKSGAPRVTNSKEAEDTFDVGTATVDDLIVFAMENYGSTLDPKLPLKALRKQVLELAAKADAAELVGADST